MSHTIHEIDVGALDALIDRLNEAKEYDLTLSADDIQLLLHALATLSTLQSQLSSKSVTIDKLRKLLGIVSASEQLSALLGKKTQSSSDKRRGKPNKGSNKKKVNRPKPKVVHHPLQDLHKGDRCPACERGTLVKVDPSVLLRITGQSPFEAVNHVAERVRCNTCGVYFTATLAQEVLADGGGQQKYGYSARALIAINKYFMGSPFFRQETLQDILSVPITASTSFDQCEYLSNDLHLICKSLITAAANAVHFHLDDTGHRILDQKEIIKLQRKSNKPQKRTGTYASGLIATLDSGHEIVLFQTNIGHAGEWIDEILEKRDPTRAPPILMSDALTCNLPSKVVAIQALCNAHGRRQFVDVLAHFPEEVEYVLHLYKQIWVHEDIIESTGLSNADRLAYHREHSLPVMETIRHWGEKQLAEQACEANSGLGQAIRYFNKHFEGLTRFCTVEGAKIDNNEMEAQLKLIVRGRKNSNFYKTLAGAAVSDVITSMIATCVRADVNPLEYFIAIQRHQSRVKAHPEAWLPWNYLQNT